MQAQNQRLREAPMRRTLDALAEMVTAAHEHGAPHIVAVGTAALRVAANRGDFLRRSQERCHLTIEVIEGITPAEKGEILFRGERADKHFREKSGRIATKSPRASVSTWGPSDSQKPI